ncbi:MAG: phosphate signaling complex protein PhoU [Candidatus Omnitrophica bacterium]|jgi:phosphate transport system protein|nr:phosphate signaling complex protein PhoU [Candidatus Omnitrophota bacterium]
MSKHFDDELKILNNELLKMAALTEEAIFKSIQALKAQSEDTAKAVISSDKQIDKLELIIEERSIALLALRQPMASDLRFITTGMKINAELERIADLAVNICQRVLEIYDKPPLKPLVDIPRLSDIARKMVREAIDAFVQRNEQLAKSVILLDPEADTIRNVIYREIIDDYITKDALCAPRAIPLILISRHLERICDHATYIAEDVIYMVKAKTVKHNPMALKNGQQ